MEQLTVGDAAVDFELPDHEGNLVKLSDIYAKENVLLVFNIGFA